MRMSLRSIPGVLGLAAVCSLAVGLPRTPVTAAQSASFTIPFEDYTLPNGLRVILSPDKATPTVAVNVWYHVGSKNEVRGRTGFAHFFEHVMFTGSGHVPYGLHDKLTEGVGGFNNGTTNNDRTTYFESVPSNYLETQLWLESDRMGFLLETLDLAKMNAQRDIVKNERRQGVDNQPYGRVDEILSHATYPASHPYSWDVIGSMADLSAATEDDVKSFFRTYYAPNNAILAIAGDFDPARTKTLITKYFGELPRGKPFERPAVSPVKLAGETRLIYEDRVPVSRLVIQWPTVGERSADTQALNLLGGILAGDRTDRLTKALVYDQQAAASVGAGQNSNEDVGEFRITVTPRPGHSLEKLEASVDALLQKLKSEGPGADELKRARASLELGFLRGLESNLNKTFMLSDGAGYHSDPGYFKKEYAAIGAVTPADVQRVAKTYLTGDRVVLSVVPMGEWAQAAKASEGKRLSRNTDELPVANVQGAKPPASAPAPPAVPPSPVKSSFDRKVIPTPGAVPPLTVPTWTRSTLANGAELVVIERKGLPLVDFGIWLVGGADQFEPFPKPGIASFVGPMMLEGTKSKNGEQLAEAQQLLGTRLAIGLGGQTGSLGFTSTTATFKDTLTLLMDVLLNPTFPADALERQRSQRLIGFKQQTARTAGIAQRVFPKLLYGDEHQLGRVISEASLTGITRDDLVAYHKAYLQPGRAMVVVSGDVNAAEVKKTIESALAPWARAGARPAFDYAKLPAPKAATIYLVDQPKAAQSTVTIGNPGPPRSTADYYALEVMNAMLGGLFQSRLNANIREEKGYSYGVGSGFGYGRGPGAFRTGGEIVSADTDKALMEFMKELRGIMGPRPVTDEELTTAKASLIQSLPAEFETVSSVNGAIASLWLQGLPDDYYQQFVAKVSGVTKEDVVRVAKQYIDLEHLVILVVGDRATIEAPIRATTIAPVVILDAEGRPVK
jgi:zinc protease